MHNNQIIINPKLAQAYLELFCCHYDCLYLPTPGNGGIPVKACCKAAASPFGRPCGGIVKWSGSMVRE